MKVKELRKLLKTFDQELEVYVPNDYFCYPLKHEPARAATRVEPHSITWYKSSKKGDMISIKQVGKEVVLIK